MKNIFQKIKPWLTYLLKFLAVFYFAAVALEIYFPNLLEIYFNPNILLFIIAILLFFEIFSKKENSSNT